MRRKPAVERSGYLAQIATTVPNQHLAAMYSTLMGSVANKSVIRLDSATKRRFCKRCRAVLDHNCARTRIVDSSRNQDRPVLRVECSCGSVKHYPLYPRQPSQVRKSAS